jgi:RND family efflux transporter MFP subunit
VTNPELREIVEWDEFTGRFEAVDRVDVRARVSGYLDSIHFQDGQFVKQGDLLFVIDQRPYEAAVAVARAAMSRAESQLQLADLELTRGERLIKQHAISAEESDTRRASRQVASANLAAARAAVRAAELDLGYTRITAPLSGRISSHRVSLGNLITGDQGPALTTIVSLDPLHFVFDASETEYLKFARLRGSSGDLGASGLPAELHLLDEENWNYKGHLDFIDNTMDQGTGTIRMRAVFPNPNNLLLPGIFGRLRLPASEPYQAILIPDKAVVADQSAKVVMTVAEDGTVVPHVVKLGPLHEKLRIVRSGLSADDRVIVKGLLRARPGSKVTPQPLESGDVGQAGSH